MRGLAALADNPLLAGVWTWSRGGGWRGPYIGNELWCDLNMWVLARWARGTGIREPHAFAEYARRAGLRGAEMRDFRELALLSAAGTLRGHYSTVHPLKRINWTRDQFLGGSDKDLAGDYRQIVEHGLLERVLAEKADAVRMWRRIVQLADRLPLGDRQDRVFARVSARYGLHLYSVIHHGWQVMLRGFAKQLPPRTAEQYLQAYDDVWRSWRRLATDHPGSGTPYQPPGFGSRNSDGVFSADPEHGIGPSVDAFRPRPAR